MTKTKTIAFEFNISTSAVAGLLCVARQWSTLSEETKDQFNHSEPLRIRVVTNPDASMADVYSLYVNTFGERCWDVLRPTEGVMFGGVQVNYGMIMSLALQRIIEHQPKAEKRLQNGVVIYDLGTL